MTDTVLSRPLVTYTAWLTGSTATAAGSLPTATCAITVLVTSSITDTLVSVVLTT